MSDKREPVWNDLRKELSGRGKNCKGPETGPECPRNNRRPVELRQSERCRVRPDLRSKTMQAPWVLFSNPWFYSILEGSKYREDMTRIRV